MVHMEEADAILGGAGPVGLWLAAELRIGGINAIVLEKRERRSEHSRAFTLHARTLEVFAARGLASGWLAEGQRIPTTHYAMLSSRLDLSGLDSDFPFVLAMPQVRTEELLEEHAAAVGVQIRRGHEVTSVVADDDRVVVTANGPDGPREFRAGYLAGCDGRRSIVRDAAGIGYEGTEDTITCVIGDVHVSDPDVPPAMTLHSEAGSFYGGRIDPARHPADRDRARPHAHGPGRAAGVRRVPGHHRAAGGPGLRHARSDLADPGRQFDVPGRPVSRRPHRAGRGCGPCALPHGRAGPQSGPAGRHEPGLEAGRGGPGAGPAGPAGQLRDRAGPGRAGRHPGHPGPDRGGRGPGPGGAGAPGHADRRPGRQPRAEPPAGRGRVRGRRVLSVRSGRPSADRPA